jgi:hypothetical protein
MEANGSGQNLPLDYGQSDHRKPLRLHPVSVLQNGYRDAGELPKNPPAIWIISQSWRRNKFHRLPIIGNPFSFSHQTASLTLAMTG